MYKFIYLFTFLGFFLVPSVAFSSSKMPPCELQLTHLSDEVRWLFERIQEVSSGAQVRPRNLNDPYDREKQEIALLERAQSGDMNALDRLARIYDSIAVSILIKQPSRLVTLQAVELALKEVRRAIMRYDKTKIYLSDIEVVDASRFSVSMNWWIGFNVSRRVIQWIERSRSKERNQIVRSERIQQDFFSIFGEDEIYSTDDIDAVEDRKMFDKINRAISSLSSREREVVELYFFDERDLSYEAIGKIMNLTGERCRQIFKAALKKIQIRSRYSVVNRV